MRNSGESPAICVSVNLPGDSDGSKFQKHHSKALLLHAGPRNQARGVSKKPLRSARISHLLLDPKSESGFQQDSQGFKSTSKLQKCVALSVEGIAKSILWCMSWAIIRFSRSFWRGLASLQMEQTGRHEWAGWARLRMVRSGPGLWCFAYWRLESL